jgi:hypothetical protein
LYSGVRDSISGPVSSDTCLLIYDGVYSIYYILYQRNTAADVSAYMCYFQALFSVTLNVSCTECKFTCKPSGAPTGVRITTTNHIRGMGGVPGEIRTRHLTKYKLESLPSEPVFSATNHDGQCKVHLMSVLAGVCVLSSIHIRSATVFLVETG